jgi:hypothetical protein
MPKRRRDANSSVKKMLSRIGKPVSFRYPAGEEHRYGVLKDRAIVRSNPGDRGVPYWDVVDLIEFKGEEYPEWIRIGYYRVPKGRLQWGSQTTIAEPVETWKRVLVDSAKQKPWFRKLLVSAVAELKK